MEVTNSFINNEFIEKGSLKYPYLKTLHVRRFEKLCIFHVRIELKREADEELKVEKDFS